MLGTLFEVVKITASNRFPYLIKGYMIDSDQGWSPCDFTEEVNGIWFSRRRIILLNENNQNEIMKTMTKSKLWTLK